MKRESLLYPKIKKWILDSFQNAWIYRSTDTFRVGIPDFLVCINGFFLAIEVKADESTPLRKIQEYELNKIKESNGITLVIKGYTVEGKNIYSIKTHTLKEVLDGEGYTIHS